MSPDTKCMAIFMLVSFFIAAGCVIALAMEVQFDYLVVNNSLVEDECTVAKIDTGEEYINTGKSGAWFYRIKTGDKAWIWSDGNYFTITVKYCIPGKETSDFRYCEEYQDGYYYQSNFQNAIDNFSTNDTTRCWYKPDLSRLTVTHDGQMAAQIAGVTILSILTAISLVVFTLGGIFLCCDA